MNTIKVCPECKLDFLIKDYRQKFCSHRCSTIYNAKKRGLNTRDRLKNCLYCNNSIKKRGYKYCSNDCQQNFLRKSKFEKWKMGEINGSSPTTGLLKNSYRKMLLNEVNNQCPQCGWAKKNPLTNTVILTVDHIDGNWQNNEFDNLRVLCYNCHTLTENFWSVK